MSSKNIFGQRIFNLRKAAGMTQKQLGEAVGLSMQAINDIEKGRRETTITKAISLARLFNTTVEYLVGVTNDRRPIDEIYFFEHFFEIDTPIEFDEIKLFAQRLKMLRIAKTLSPDDVYDDVLSEQLESGNIIPTLPSLLTLADFFKVSLDYLCGRTDNPEVNR